MPSIDDLGDVNYMTQYEDKCEMCGDVVHTYDYDSGYGEHSHNHLTVKPHEERRIVLPERDQDLTVTVCMECQMKEPSLHSLIKRKRIEWLTDAIQGKKNKINHIRIESVKLLNSIPKIQLQIKIFRDLKKEIEKGV